MGGFIQGKTTAANMPVKRFGYVLSAIFLGFTVALMMIESPFSALLFLILMYILTGALWMPALIKPLYNLFGRKLFPAQPGEEPPAEKETYESPGDDR